MPLFATMAPFDPSVDQLTMGQAMTNLMGCIIVTCLCVALFFNLVLCNYAPPLLHDDGSSRMRRRVVQISQHVLGWGTSLPGMVFFIVRLVAVEPEGLLVFFAYSVAYLLAVNIFHHLLAEWAWKNEEAFWESQPDWVQRRRFDICWGLIHIDEHGRAYYIRHYAYYADPNAIYQEKCRRSCDSDHCTGRVAYLPDCFKARSHNDYVPCCECWQKLRRDRDGQLHYVAYGGKAYFLDEDSAGWTYALSQACSDSIATKPCGSCDARIHCDSKTSKPWILGPDGQRLNFVDGSEDVKLTKDERCSVCWEQYLASGYLKLREEIGGYSCRACWTARKQCAKCVITDEKSFPPWYNERHLF